MQSTKKIFHCNCIKENGLPCGNPLYAVKNGDVIIKRHGREINVSTQSTIKIKCERCGGITRVGM